jgi:hypothetical protein
METKNVKVSVQEALSNMVEAYQDIENWADEDAIRTIENILEENIDKVVKSDVFQFILVILIEFFIYLL